MVLHMPQFSWVSVELRSCCATFGSGRINEKSEKKGIIMSVCLDPLGQLLLLLLIALALVKEAASVREPVLSVTLPAVMENCTHRCQCWYPRDKSIDQLRHSTCRTICNNSDTDHTRPCFNFDKCHVYSRSNCSLICSSSPYNCVANDFIMDSEQTNIVEIVSYTVIGIISFACIAAVIVYALRRSKLVNRK